MRRHDHHTTVVTALDEMLKAAGDPQSAYDTRHLSPRDKALIALARVAAAGIKGERLFEIVVSVSARIEHRGPRSQEFLWVQIAKVVHRLASGTHRTRSGLYRLPSKYPNSTGQTLRLLGRQLWEKAAVGFEPDDLSEIIREAEPAANAYLAAVALQASRQQAFASEMVHARSLGLGPSRLAAVERQLRQRYGLAKR